MARPKAFITRTLLPEALEIVERVADVDLWPDEWPPSVEELHRRAAGVDGILTTIMDRVDAALMDAAPNLKVISQLAVGLDNVDVAEATRRGIPVGNTPGVLSKSTADLAFALLLGAARRTSESERLAARRRVAVGFPPDSLVGAGRSRSNPGHRRVGPDWPRDSTARQRVRHAYHLPLPHPQRGRRGRIRRMLRRLPNVAQRVRFCGPERAPHPGNPPSHQRRRTGGK